MGDWDGCCVSLCAVVIGTCCVLGDMATHDFRCDPCQTVAERWIPMQDPEPQRCDGCGAEMTKLFSAGTKVIFNGALYLHSRESFHDHTASEVRKKIEASPEFREGKIRRKDAVRWQ